MGLEEADTPIKGRECAKARKRSCGILVELYRVYRREGDWLEPSLTSGQVLIMRDFRYGATNLDFKNDQVF